MYEKFEYADGVLRVWGESDVLEAGFAHEGVVRIRHAPNARRHHLSFPRLPRKASFAVSGGEPREGTVTEEEGAVVLTDGDLVFGLELGSGAWTVTREGFVLASALGVRGDPGSQLRRSTLSLAAPQGAAYLGFGAKVGPMNKRGMRFTFWNTDAFQHHTDSDPLYISIPFTTVLH